MVSDVRAFGASAPQRSQPATGWQQRSQPASQQQAAAVPSPMAVGAASWFGRVLSLDTRSLALFRVALGWVACIDIARRADTLDFYTDEGSFIQVPGDTQHRCPHSDSAFPLASAHVRALGGRCLFHQLWFYKGTWALQATLFALTAASSLCFSAGFLTPISGALTWVGMTALHGRNECVNDSSDKMMRNLLFWGCLLPLGAAGSVDELLRCSRAGTEARSSLSSFLRQVNPVCCQLNRDPGRYDTNRAFARI